jgi:NADPH-dependent 2,4-dienoyl-CoA reductase/sulfur reductase-like enzyme
MGFIEDFIRGIILNLFTFSYFLVQWLLDKLLSPTPPPPGAKLHRPKIAVIGAGLTGVSAASHCIGHGFHTTLFEAGDEDSVGGIWTVIELFISRFYIA